MKNKPLFIISIIALLLLIVGGFTYAYFSITTGSEGEVKFGNQAGRGYLLEFDYGEEKIDASNLNVGDTVIDNFKARIVPGTENNIEYGIYIIIEENSFKKCDYATYYTEIRCDVDDPTICRTNNCALNAQELTYVLKEGNEEIARGDLTGKTGTVKLADVKKVLEEETSFDYTLEITYNETGKEQNHNIGAVLRAQVVGGFSVEVEEEKDPLAVIIEQAKTDKPDFSKTSCLNGTNSEAHSGSDCDDEENGLYKETTSLGDTYYYRGSVNNNWVKYGTTAEGQPIWWRIIRINEDRTVRLIYAGEGEQVPASADQVGGQGGYWMSNSYGISNTSYAFNESYNYNAYVGYMYGTPGSDSFAKEHGYDLIDSGEVNKLQSSDIKKTIDEWYKKNLADEGTVLSGSTGFCGDRTPAVYKASGYTNDGYGTEKTNYKAYDRIVKDKIPSYECPDSKHDLYTTKTDKGNGNGALEYPVGFITIDEVVYAGTNWDASSNYGFWLRTGQFYWSLSPYNFGGRAYVFDVGSRGGLGSVSVAGTVGVGARPTVNLKAEALTTEGCDGTIENPYFVKKIDAVPLI